MIPYGRQSISEDDIASVVEVLRGDWLTQGPTIERFEAAVAEYVGARYAVAYSSGTSALHGATWAAGLGPGDLVATSPLTFMASANCARYVGATPVLVDIDIDTWNIDLELLPNDLRGLVAVHFAGLPADLSQLDKSRRPSVIIEDAAHALGATTPSGPVGNCAHSDMCCFSFHPVKPITTAEGGMVTTNDPALAERLRRFRSHGIVRKPEVDAWYYEITEVGFNYRMTDVQAALGLSQLGRLDDLISRRNQVAEIYRRELSDLSISLPPVSSPGFRHGYHLFAICVRDRKRVFNSLRELGIGVQVHYIPIHHHPVSSDCVIPPGGLPVCDEVYDGIISLPIFPSMIDSQIDKTIDACRRVVGLR